jgi:heterodisulfide reductase subunit A-like polyferredoxin
MTGGPPRPAAPRDRGHRLNGATRRPGGATHEREWDLPKDVLVIGGGIAGIQASLDLAEMGIPVHLVEKSPSIGGVMAQLDKTFPTNDCSI